jgi:very-short-patch-repair endonuclease
VLAPRAHLLRLLARHHWLRTSGTPRLTILVGDGARALWDHWRQLVGAAPALDGTADLATALRDASAQAAAAIATTAGALVRWRAGAPSRDQALLDEGLLELEPTDRPSDGPDTSGGLTPTPSRDLTSSPKPPPIPTPSPQLRPGPRVGATRTNPDTAAARSAAEALLFEALEATPATTGRFELNAKLSVFFGPGPAEVDLLDRTGRIAIEVDGYHHFDDPDRYRRDRRKDLALQLHGLLVIRLLADDVLSDPRAAVQVVCHGLAGRKGRQE